MCTRNDINDNVNDGLPHPLPTQIVCSEKKHSIQTKIEKHMLIEVNILIWMRTILSEI